MATEIAASSDEQARGVERISKAMSRLEAVTQNNAANAEKSAGSATAMSRELENTRKHLGELVGLIGLRDLAHG